MSPGMRRRGVQELPGPSADAMAFLRARAPSLPRAPLVPIAEAAAIMRRTAEEVRALALAGIIEAEFADGEPVRVRPARVRGGRLS